MAHKCVVATGQVPLSVAMIWCHTMNATLDHAFALTALLQQLIRWVHHVVQPDRSHIPFGNLLNTVDSQH